MSFLSPFPGGNDEDDDFSSLSTNSNLPSLFQDSTSSMNSKKSLVYTAPKQPSVQNTISQPTMNIITATAVNCYKLSNDKYEPLQGKIGIALLGNDEAKAYQLFLYFNKQKPIASVKITAEFTFTSQPGNFCTFYDDQGQNWAVLFDSKDLTKFLDEVNKVKTKLGATKEKVIEPPITKEQMTQESPAVSRKPEASDTESTKTKLMSRIAKMGQPILPLSGAIVAENSDSDEVVQTSPEPHVEIVKGKKPRPVPSTKPIPNETLYSHSTMILPTPMSNISPYQMMPYLSTPVNMAASGGSGHFETLMSETRTHNSEIRMHLCRITDKIDAVLSKQNAVPEVQSRAQMTPTDVHPQLLSILQVLQREAVSHSEKIDRVLEWMNKPPVTQVNSTPPTPPPRTKIEPDPQITQLEERIKCLQSEQQEMERRADQLADRNSALTSLISDKEAKESCFQVQLVQNERDLDSLRDQLKESQDRLTEADQRARLLESKLKEKEEQNGQLASQIEKLRDQNGSQNLLENQKIQLLESQILQLELQLKDNSELHSQLLAQNQQFSEDKDRSLENEHKLSRLELALKEETGKKSELSRENQQLLAESKNWRTVADNLQCRLDEQLAKGDADVQNANQAEQVKKIMNKVYKEIIRQFDPHQTYAFPDIKGAVSEIIREVTLSMLNDQPMESRTSEPVTSGNQPEHNKQDDPINSSNPLQPVSEEAAEVTQATNVPPQDDGVAKVTASPPNATDENQISAVSDANEARSESAGTTLPAPSSASDPEVQERSLSFLESLHSSLAAARSPNTEQVWKPDPPPPPLFDDFDNDDDDDWLT